MVGSRVQYLSDKGLITPPPFLRDNVHYECMMGSVAYGVSSDTSDQDVYGFAIPPKHIIFPHLNGHIEGFSKNTENFQNYQQHHIKDGEQEYDLDIYNIVHYFRLCMDNNPNIVDSLWVPDRCVLHITQIGNLVRENRKMFLHKGSWQKRKGYAFSQLHKAENKNPIGKRKELVEKFGVDTKFLYHVVRLVLNAEQILTEGDLDLTRDRVQLKAIRRGERSLEDIKEWFSEQEKSLEKVYNESKLQHSPDVNKIKQLLLNCLEMHYGNLDKCVVNVDKATQCLNDIKQIIGKYE